MYGFYIVNYSLVSNFIPSTYSNIKKILTSHKNAIKLKKNKIKVIQLIYLLLLLFVFVAFGLLNEFLILAIVLIKLLYVNFLSPKIFKSFIISAAPFMYKIWLSF